MPGKPMRTVGIAATVFLVAIALLGCGVIAENADAGQEQ